MARLDGFDANKVTPATDFEPLPEGKYLAVITDSEMTPTKRGNGRYLEFTFEVIDGPHRGRRLWSRHNLDNPNPQAVQIAQGELSAVCRAVGVMRPKDSIELHNLPLLVSVIRKRRDDTGDVVNEIRGYAKKEAVTGEPEDKTANALPLASQEGDLPF